VEGRDAAEAVKRMRECVDRTVEVVEDMLLLARSEYGHDVDTAMLHIRHQFERRAKRVLESGDLVGAGADYANYSAVLVVLSEAKARIAKLEDAVLFRDSVINTIGELDSL